MYRLYHQYHGLATVTVVSIIGDAGCAQEANVDAVLIYKNNTLAGCFIAQNVYGCIYQAGAEIVFHI